MIRCHLLPGWTGRCLITAPAVCTQESAGLCPGPLRTKQATAQDIITAIFLRQQDKVYKEKLACLIKKYYLRRNL